MSYCYFKQDVQDEEDVFDPTLAILFILCILF